MAVQRQDGTGLVEPSNVHCDWCGVSAEQAQEEER